MIVGGEVILYGWFVGVEHQTHQLTDAWGIATECVIDTFPIGELFICDEYQGGQTVDPLVGPSAIAVHCCSHAGPSFRCWSLWVGITKALDKGFPPGPRS